MADPDTGEPTTQVEVSSTLDIDDPQVPDVMAQGDLEVLGRMPYSSNGTFLSKVTADGEEVTVIYKPQRGERPLWDFPPGLWRREIAMRVLSDALGFDVIPPTVRNDGPLGEGSVQYFVPAHFEHHYFTLEDDPAHAADLQRLCVLDVVGNNTDRKSGHCLLAPDGRVWGIDNGLSFHAEFKLRTVIWAWGGHPLPDELTDSLCRLLEAGLPDELRHLLDPFERDGVLTRARALLSTGRFPVDDTGRRYPWPLV